MSWLSKLFGHNTSTLASLAHIADVVVANTVFKSQDHQAIAQTAVAGLQAVAEDAASHDNGANLKAMLAPIVVELVAAEVAKLIAPHAAPADPVPPPPADPVPPPAAVTASHTTLTASGDLAPNDALAPAGSDTLTATTATTTDERPFVSELPDPADAAPALTIPAEAILAAPTDHTQVDLSAMGKTLDNQS